jgi:nucleotide-binding universal stress UspA family protein
MKNKATILVTTDLSTNSKAGIRFAIQLAAQTQSKLVFYHVVELLTPTSWSKEDAMRFVDTTIKTGEAQLNTLLEDMYKQFPAPSTKYETVVELGTDVDNLIINYAKKIEADFICMSTHGAGILEKFVGTNASSLVSFSPIPVIVVPRYFHTKRIEKIGYASDFEHIDHEMPIVQAFAASLNAQLDVYHFHYKVHEANSNAVFEKIKLKYADKKTVFHEPQICLDYSLVENLQRLIDKEKPSIMVMFTQQKDNWLERFFIESKAVDMASNSKIPLLTMSKNRIKN